MSKHDNHSDQQDPSRPKEAGPTEDNVVRFPAHPAKPDEPPTSPPPPTAA